MSSELLYLEAADVLLRAQNKEGSLKSLVINNHFQHKKPLYALVCKSIQQRHVIEAAIANSGAANTKLYGSNKCLCLCLGFDVLLGEGLNCSFSDQDWHEFITTLKRLPLTLINNGGGGASSYGDDEKANNTTGPPPKYLRVNTLKTSRCQLKRIILEESEGYFYYQNLSSTSGDGLLLPPPPPPTYASYLARLVEVHNESCGSAFLPDFNLRSLFAFAPSSDLHEFSFFLNGLGVLQDKASALVAPLLAPPKGSIVIDACSAPGSKTAHLAAIMDNSGSIFAIDRDARRCATMRQLLRRRGVTNCHVECRDFLTVDPLNDPGSDISKAQYILVDPSCSGSGMFWDVGRLLDNDQHAPHEGGGSAAMSNVTSNRLHKLANFQAMLLNHALSFPAVRRVVYSTCSIHEEENEAVVAEVLRRWTGIFKLVTVWPSIPSRGRKLPGLPLGQRCLRLDAPDLTIGFFIACFERI